MITDNSVWIVNIGDKDFDRIDLNLKKQILLKPNIPQQLPTRVAMNYVSSYKNIIFCKNPENYFNQRKLRQLIIRDAGIGDLLLLEPIIRTLDNDNNREVSFLSMYPDIYKYNPYITENILMHIKENINNVNHSDYDCFEDLRNYSETTASRNKKHRTDIYNEKFNLDIKDKEPRIYTNGKEKSLLDKKKGYRYIGIQLDASHSYRRYFKYNDLINYILNIDKKNIVVIFGGYDYIKLPKNKRIIDYQGKTTIRDVINIIKDIDYMIAVDSGLMHIALSLHISTVCIFNIITPDFRLRYYTGEYKVITGNVDCIGCGDFHMYVCKYGDIKKNKNFVPPCMNLDSSIIYKKMIEMQINNNIRIFSNEFVEKPIVSNINLLPDKKLTMPIIVLNEEKNLPRFIELVIKNKNIGRVIAIDGGSTDQTVELLKKAGAFVYIHNYDVNYHDMQAVQRNYSCSFIEDEENILIMDIDECFSKELAEYLPVLANNIEKIEYSLISRKTFKYYRDINNHLKQIKDYPDWQPRFFKWNRKFKWVGSPHHNIYNAPAPIKIKKDIIHFECENKNRKELEEKWSRMHKATKKIYG